MGDLKKIDIIEPACVSSFPVNSTIKHMRNGVIGGPPYPYTWKKSSCLRQIGHGEQRGSVALSEALLPQLQRAAEQLDGFGVLPHGREGERQIIHAADGLWVIGAQNLATQKKLLVMRVTAYTHK